MPTIPNNSLVTYTGTLGAGMTAHITDLGSYGFSLDMPDGWGEWKDTRRYRVDGPRTAYDAFLALNVGGWGANAAHPYINTISGGPMKYIAETQPDGARGGVVEVSYSRPPMGIWGDPNPLARLPVVNFGFNFIKLPAEKDSQGYVVVNSAGDLFDPAQTIDIAVLKIRIGKWLSSYSYSNASTIAGKVNASSVTLTNTIGTVAARCLKCLNYAPAGDIIVGSNYVFTLFDFELRLDKYDRKLIDRGYRAWYSDNGNTTRKGKLGSAFSLEPLPQPVLLDGTGKPLLPAHLTIVDPKNKFSAFASASPAQLPSYLTAVRGTDSGGGFYLPYRIEPEADFGPLASLGL